MEKTNELEQQLVQFYSELLHDLEEDQSRDIVEITRHIPQLVTPKHNIMLMHPIDRTKVKEVVFQMEKGKAPGPNGFTIDFFQS